MGKKTRSRGVYRGKKQAKTASSPLVDDDPMYDKVDQFMMGSDQVDLDDSDVDIDESDVPQRVMQLSHEQDSSSDEDDLDDSSSDEEEKTRTQQRHKRQDEKYEEWGRMSGRHTYHGNDVETNHEGYDAAVQEEEEAKYLQEKQAAAMDEADFAVEEGSESESDDEFWDEAAQKEEFQKAAKAIEDVSLDPEDSLLSSGASSSRKKLTKAEKRKIVEQDAPELVGLLQDFESKLGDLKNNVQPLLTQAMKRDLPTSDGISFLEAKFHLLLNYCMNIGFYMLMKAEGKQVRDHPVISQLVKLRLLLDKIKPIDQKLHYQVQKLLKMSESGQVDEVTSEALQHRPNLDALDDDEEEAAGDSVYKIKKVAPTVYQTDSKDKKKDRQRKLKTGTAMTDFIREEFSEAPQEISFTGRPKMTKEQKQEVDFEEDNFMRLTRQAKARRKQEKELLQRSELEDPLDFRDITGFGQLSDDDEDDRTSREKLSAIVNRVGQEGTSYNPEVDLPYEGWEKRKPLAKRSLRDFQKSDDSEEDEPYGHPMNAPEDMEDDHDDDDDEVSEDEYYAQMEQAAKKRKLEATRETQLPDYYDDSLKAGSKRSVTYQIEHNKGLTRHRPKKMRNPRVRYKLKAEKASKKLKDTGHRAVKDQLQPYGGESSGIRKSVKRSVNLGK